VTLVGLLLTQLERLCTRCRLRAETDHVFGRDADVEQIFKELVECMVRKADYENLLRRVLHQGLSE
jgi:hypothetical protein